MNAHSQPLAVLFCFQKKKNELRFVGRQGIIVLTVRSHKLLRILALCNGLRTVAEIQKTLRTVKLMEILDLLDVCHEHSIVRDSRELFADFHRDSSNPMAFSHDLSEGDVAEILATPRLCARSGKTIRLASTPKSKLLQTLSKRHSTRTFKKASVSFQKLSGLLQAMYGKGKKGNWSVPSGGALYPLDLYVIVLNKTEQLEQGVYRFDPERNTLVTMYLKDPNVWISVAMNAHSLLENAAYIICVGANLWRTTSKYANRGYRHALIEAGHSAQNAYLFCTEQHLGVVEYAGFNDEIFGRELGLELPYEVALTTLIVGVKDSSRTSVRSSDQKFVEAEKALRGTLVGDDKPITSVSVWEPTIPGYELKRFGAQVSYRPPFESKTKAAKERCVSFGTGHTSSEAVVKALAEGFERHALEQFRSDRFDRPDKLSEPWMDPRIITPYGSKQIEALSGITRFDPRKKIHFVQGTRLVDGSLVWVPSDLVFYPKKVSGENGKVPSFYHANSSGVAAHFNKSVAVESALLELIERDAFALTWHSKREVRRLRYAELPGDIIERVCQWKDRGYQVSFLDLTVDATPVILVMITSDEKMPALFSGASSKQNPMDAARSAWNEAEFMAMTWYDRKVKSGMKPEDIYSPDDHGQFYNHPRNLVHAKWLLESRLAIAWPKKKVLDFAQFDPIVVDITPKDHACGLSVVRVLSASLLPMNFGYGSEHYRHSRMRVVGFKVNERQIRIPHFFA